MKSLIDFRFPMIASGSTPLATVLFICNVPSKFFVIIISALSNVGLCRSAGLTSQQHQALLALRAFLMRKRLPSDSPAKQLQVTQHTAIELVDRLTLQNLVLREASMLRREIMGPYGSGRPMAGKSGWEKMVPEKATSIIKERTKRET